MFALVQTGSRMARSAWGTKRSTAAARAIRGAKPAANAAINGRRRMRTSLLGPRSKSRCSGGARLFEVEPEAWPPSSCAGTQQTGSPVLSSIALWRRDRVGSEGRSRAESSPLRSDARGESGSPVGILMAEWAGCPATSPTESAQRIPQEAGETLDGRVDHLRSVVVGEVRSIALPGELLLCARDRREMAPGGLRQEGIVAVDHQIRLREPAGSAQGLVAQ